MHLAQFFERSVVRDERKFSSTEISGKMVHAPNCRLHFEQKGCVVAFVFLQFSAGISDDTMLTFLIDLRKNGPKAPGLLVIAEAGIDDEG